MDSDQLEKTIDRYMNLLEAELGEDIVPIVIILLCRIAVKYNLNADWVATTIMMGIKNEMPPPIDNQEVFKFDS